jgi:hypothetical protein
VFSQQQSGDHEPRNDEEYIDSNVATREPRNAGMEKNDEENRHRPETFDIRTKAPIVRGRSGLFA